MVPRQSFFYLLILIWPVLASAAADERYLQQLVNEAHEQKLAQRPEWRALVHYKPRLILPGVKSLADAPHFFNAKNGKTDPAAELDATLASFFSDTGETERQHPQCAFIARYHWLKKELDFDPDRLPERPCHRFNEWRRALDAKEITLIFPAAYLNNPASMFGHTLLRVDARGQDERTRLLAYAISYAADTGDQGGMAFAVKGLFGGYPGLFSIGPYYVRVRQYNDLENRDIWEYRLNFTEQEIDLLLRHVWELRLMYFDYFFFDENCSYHLLSLFEVARPELKLTDQFGWWALPTDTVRAVTQEPGMLEEVVYRPARSNVLRHRLRGMDKDQQSLAKRLANGKLALTDEPLRGLSVEDQAKVLELAFEHVEYERIAGDRPQQEAAARSLALLNMRSQLDVADQAPNVPVPAVRPDQGHKTARIGIGYGEEDDRSFAELSIRPVYHDLLDPEPGFVRGAQIELFDFSLRYYDDDDEVRLQELMFVDIVSLSLRNRFLKPMSWKVNFGLTRKRFSPDDEPLVVRLNGGAGLTYEPLARTLVYGFVEGSLEADNEFEEGYALGAGGSLGVIGDVSRRWRINLSAQALRFEAGDEHSAYDLTLAQRVSVSRQSAVRLNVSRKREFDDYWTRADIAWQFYF